jgi:hypothetical protein
MKIKLEDLEDITLDGVNEWDYPDMSDASIGGAKLISENRWLTDDELDYINETYIEQIQEWAREAV